MSDVTTVIRLSRVDLLSITSSILFLSIVVAGCAHAPPSRFKDPRCLVVRGCPPAARVSRCPEVDAPLVEEALARGHDGDQVTMMGRLESTALICTMALCPNHCCNACNGALGVTSGGKAVDLIGKDLSAAGDDSLVCFKTGQRGQWVIARGTLRLGAIGNPRLEVTDLCAR